MTGINKIFLDVENGISRLGGNEKLYIHLIKKFNEILKNDLPEFERVNSSEELEGFQKEIHSLKGVSGNLSAIALYEVCTSIDATLKLGKNDYELYHELKRVYHETQFEVERFLKINVI